MDKKTLFMAMLLAGSEPATEAEHLHVHYELPEWEDLKETVVRTSGDTSTGVSDYNWEGGQ